jgi:hypothetical protein
VYEYELIVFLEHIFEKKIKIKEIGDHESKNQKKMSYLKWNTS